MQMQIVEDDCFQSGVYERIHLVNVLKTFSNKLTLTATYLLIL